KIGSEKKRVVIFDSRPLRCEEIVGKPNSLTQRRQGRKANKGVLLSDLCGLAALREGFQFFKVLLEGGEGKKKTSETPAKI
ncbi:MAG TPA: hypothetical protein VMG63_09340, partial [Terriglobia bacterium]|nr:hypothetical protein [Terriglobia bacterium]